MSAHIVDYEQRRDRLFSNEPRPSSEPDYGPSRHVYGNACPFSNLYFDIGRTDDIVSQNRRWSALLYALPDLM